MLMKFATRQFSTSNLQCWRIAVIGSGLMGSGIAQVSAQSEHFVALVDQSKPILDKAQKAIEANIVRVARKKFESDNEKQATFVKNVLKNITLTTDVNNAVSEADLVIEAVAEKLQLKQELLAQIEQAVPRKTIIATNTSSLRLQDISKNLKRKENFGGLHFFNPVPVMKLLEVVRGESTSDDTFNYLLKYGESIGKVTVKCKDTPGFIVNRLLVPYMLEAMRLYERGDASKEDIDQAMKLGAGYPMGPFQLLDYVGLDTTKFIQDGWHSSYPSEENFRPVEVLDKLVKEGKFGMKTGEGFYKYESKK